MRLQRHKRILDFAVCAHLLLGLHTIRNEIFVRVLLYLFDDFLDVGVGHREDIIAHEHSLLPDGEHVLPRVEADDLWAYAQVVGVPLQQVLLQSIHHGGRAHHVKAGRIVFLLNRTAVMLKLGELYCLNVVDEQFTLVNVEILLVNATVDPVDRTNDARLHKEELRHVGVLLQLLLEGFAPEDNHQNAVLQVLIAEVALERVDFVGAPPQEQRGDVTGFRPYRFQQVVEIRVEHQLHVVGTLAVQLHDHVVECLDTGFFLRVLSAGPTKEHVQPLDRLDATADLVVVMGNVFKDALEVALAGHHELSEGVRQVKHNIREVHYLGVLELLPNYFAYRPQLSRTTNDVIAHRHHHGVLEKVRIGVHFERQTVCFHAGYQFPHFIRLFIG